MAFSIKKKSGQINQVSYVMLEKLVCYFTVKNQTFHMLEKNIEIIFRK